MYRWVALVWMVGCSRDVTDVWSGDCKQSEFIDVLETVGMELDLVDQDGVVTGKMTLDANTTIEADVEGTHDGDTVDLETRNFDEGSWVFALKVEDGTLVGGMDFFEPDGDPFGPTYRCVLE